MVRFEEKYTTAVTYKSFLIIKPADGSTKFLLRKGGKIVHIVNRYLSLSEAMEIINKWELLM